ncbi:G-D-S-L family lipolytic protein [Flavobacterium sp.]|uniref:G-D-S-L family lipolytic protein n=1 Tax=Flavobacterium sp. TaxID=239 RepID=UPI0026018884|nr:G-D-S-L family lipolytic protein [Flavobacterium sp.]
MIKNIKWLFLVSLTFVACNNDDEATVEEVPVTAGTADFSKYVALGNSITAGYSDGALFKAGQLNAYPKLMADQFALVGGGAFNIPMMNDNVGGIVGVPGVGPRLIFNGTSPVPLPGGVPTTPLLPALTGPFNNMGVPGAKSFHLLAPAYGNPAGLGVSANPYFVRFASSTSTSILADAMMQQPTFFSLWIGNNDVLGYATTGGDGTNPITPTTGAPGVGFDGTYGALVTTLTSGGAKGVVANIPYVSTIPFFKTVPFNPLTSKVLGGGDVPTGEATIDQLNALLYGPLKQALTAFGAGDRINVLSKTAGNPLLIKDETLTNLSAQLTAAFTPTLGAATAGFYGSVFGQARQATSADLVLLTTQSAIGAAPPGAPAPLNKYGITYPLQDKHILIPTEIAEIKDATDSYNVTIKAAADASGLAFVDANAVMNQLANGGIRFDNYHFTSQFVQGGAFGLDGVHLTARANAYIANKFLEAINAKYNSTFRMYKPQNFVISYPAGLPN